MPSRGGSGPLISPPPAAPYPGAPPLKSTFPPPRRGAPATGSWLVANFPRPATETTFYPHFRTREVVGARSGRDFGGGYGLGLGVLCGSARSHLATGEVENAGATTKVGHLEQRSAAGLFNVITMCGNGKDVEWQRGHYCVRLYPGP